MKSIGRIVMLSAVLAVVSAGWLGCVVDNGTGPSGGTAPRITTAALPGGTAGTAYSQTLKASGDAPITWSLESGALPAGLNLLGSGTISGTPTTAGTYSFSVKAINSAGSDVSSFSITITGGSTTPTTPTSYSLDGVWETGDLRVAVSGSTGVFSTIGTTPIIVDAANKGYIHIGDQIWRNLTSTGNLTWSGQVLLFTGVTSSPGVCTGVSWSDVTLTMSADGNSLLRYAPNSTTPSVTYTRGNYSLDGVWETGDLRIAVSGSTGVFSTIGTTPIIVDAANKGYIHIGDQIWRNLTSTGNLTWSGQVLLFTGVTSSPNVCTGVSWSDVTLTMSADGNSLLRYAPNSTTPSVTYTRWR